MSGGRLPKRVVFGNLEGAVRRGRGEKEKEWTDCVQSNIWAFDIANEKTFESGDAHPNERRAGAEAGRVWKLEGAVRRGRGKKEKEWTDCVQSNI